jgi:type II secretory ATPase GspE/PulE/Tfp pilus assembly ATPase PilB-like protein
VQNERAFADRAGVVSVGLMDGTTVIGSLEVFVPLAEELELRIEKQTPEGRQRMVRHIPVEHMAFVAFHKFPGDMTEPSREADVHYELILEDGQKFDVRVLEETLSHEVGFYARPESLHSFFREYFFFAWGVRIKKNKEPLGTLLVQRQALEQAQLNAGLAVQDQQRRAKLGQILSEQGKVSAQKVEEVAKEQQAKRPAAGRTMRLGELLVASGAASEEDIERALAEQKTRKGKRLGQVLVDMGIVSEEEIARTLAQKFQLPFVDLETADIRPEAVAEVPAILIDRYRLFPYFSDEKNLFIALSDPLALEAISMLQFSVGKRIHEVISTVSQIESYIEPFLISSEEKAIEKAAESEVESSDDDAVVRLINRIIIDAYRRGASDIHVEPFGNEESLRIRFRVDGTCTTYREMPASYRAQVASRIKIMAGLDISERRRPQDGKIKFQIGKRKIELRVATLPTGEGDEDVVMRILAGGEPLPLQKMGFSEPNLEAVRRVLAKPYGLVLAVGPTGSGKTTTLHSLLGVLNTEQRKIWTAEDPIEITQKGLRQVQVNSRIGFTFAAAMRSFLRADPDIIMVGEMRDQETAHTGVEASLTGHLVFSTLHTNNAPETVTRLLDMGLDPFSFSDALLGIVAQRLARRLCLKCRKPRPLQTRERAELLRHFHGVEVPELAAGVEAQLWEAPGCNECNGTGYKGRLAIHEVLVNDEAITGAILRKATVAEVRSLALESGMRTLVQDGIFKCLQGHTDLSQVLAVASS